MVYAFMADGCEEVEALAVIDLLRRAGEEVELVSIHNKDMTQGSHGTETAAAALWKGKVIL